MTNHYRATPEQWETIKQYTGSSDPYSCILELRARIEALDAAQQPNSSASLTSSPADSLIDRVAKAIYDAPNTHKGWHSEARAAILEVAAWLLENECGYNAARWLEREANQ